MICDVGLHNIMKTKFVKYECVPEKSSLSFKKFVHIKSYKKCRQFEYFMSRLAAIR